MMIRTLAARLKQWRGMLKEQWGQITNDRLKIVDGRKERLAGLLLSYGYPQEQADLEIERFFGSAPERQERIPQSAARYS